MNRKLLKMFVLPALFLPAYSIAQTDGEDALAKAAISRDYCVSISTESTVKEFYTLDISHLEILTVSAAQDKFGYIENNLISYEVDVAKKSAIMHLHLDRTTVPKDVVWWSEYLNSLCGL